jgi:hypothetical protein
VTRRRSRSIGARHGPILGFGFGFGELGHGDRRLNGLGGDLHAGWMISPRWAALIDGDAVIHRVNDETTIVQGMIGGAVQVWATGSLWLRGTGGVGWSKTTTTTNAQVCTDDILFGHRCSNESHTQETSSEKVPAFAITAGFDLGGSSSVLVGIEGRYSALAYRDGLSTDLEAMVVCNILPHM